jgi:hypothetical protein
LAGSGRRSTPYRNSSSVIDVFATNLETYDWTSGSQAL